MSPSNFDVLSMDKKDEKLLFTRILRAWAKENRINQFDMAIRLIGLFYRVIGVQDTYIRDKELRDDFEKYFLALDAGYDTMFEILNNFVESVDNKFVPRFGE